MRTIFHQVFPKTTGLPDFPGSHGESSAAAGCRTDAGVPLSAHCRICSGTAVAMAAIRRRSFLQPIAVHDASDFPQQVVPGTQGLQLRCHNLFAGVLFPAFPPRCRLPYAGSTSARPRLGVVRRKTDAAGAGSGGVFPFSQAVFCGGASPSHWAAGPPPGW